VPTGDVHALADALQGVAETVAEPTWALQGYRDGLAAKAAYVSRFDAVRVRAEFLDDLGRLGASARSRRGPRPVSRPSA
jgi:hypothetical protein